MRTVRSPSGGGLSITPSEEPGHGLGRDPGAVGEVSGGLALDGGPDHPESLGLPRSRGRPHGGGLACAGSADGALDPVPARAELADKVLLLVGQAPGR